MSRWYILYKYDLASHAPLENYEICITVFYFFDSAVRKIMPCDIGDKTYVQMKSAHLQMVGGLHVSQF